MFRISHYMKYVVDPKLEEKTKTLSQRITNKECGPVVIWNLIRKCNLKCKHCYTNSLYQDYDGELSTNQALNTIHDLKKAKVPVIIFSGGEPLLRDDIFTLSKEAKDLGFYTALSTNGTLLNESNLQAVIDANYNYVGISLDGIGEVHDNFRGEKGAFDKSLHAIRLCLQNDIKVGIRFCLNEYTAGDVDKLIKFVEVEGINKLYMSHLNYSGRGKSMIKKDAHQSMTRATIEKLFEYAYKCNQEGKSIEIVTGNNDADGVFFLHWVKKHHPEAYSIVKEKLLGWGGNSTGIGIANIDNEGNVNPDSFWWNHPIGNVKVSGFETIWNGSTDPIMTKLKTNQRDLKGRCSTCHYKQICNGNSRVRAYQMTGDVLAEDPGCYLSLEEISASSELQQRES